MNPTYDRIEPCPNGRHVAVDSEKVGYISSSGKEIIPRRFAFASCFTDGLAKVTFEARGKGNQKTWGKTGVIDEKGNLVLNPVCERVHVQAAEENKATFIVQKDNGGWAFVEPPGKVIGSVSDLQNISPPLIHENAPDAPHPVNRGCVIHNPKTSWDCSGGKWGYADSNGREVIALQFYEASRFKGDVLS